MSKIKAGDTVKVRKRSVAGPGKAFVVSCDGQFCDVLLHGCTGHPIRLKRSDLRHRKGSKRIAELEVQLAHTRRSRDHWKSIALKDENES